MPWFTAYKHVADEGTTELDEEGIAATPGTIIADTRALVLYQDVA